jgi:hypothetical protein
MTLMPHNHDMWAVVGVYTGREDNIFWRRHQGDPAGHVEASSSRSLGPRDVVPLGRDIIHSVINPTGVTTSAIQVYGGNLFVAHMSEWEPEVFLRCEDEHAAVGRGLSQLVDVHCAAYLQCDRCIHARSVSYLLLPVFVWVLFWGPSHAQHSSWMT